MAKNELRIGRLTEIDYERGYGKVVFENLGMLETDIPFCNPNTTIYPKIEDLVLVGYTFDNQAFIIGHFYNQTILPSNTKKSCRVLELGEITGESQILYNIEDGTVSILAPMESLTLDGSLSEIISFWKENKEKIQSWKESSG